RRAACGAPRGARRASSSPRDRAFGGAGSAAGSAACSGSRGRPLPGPGVRPRIGTLRVPGAPRRLGRPSARGPRGGFVVQVHTEAALELLPDPAELGDSLTEGRGDRPRPEGRIVLRVFGR